MERDISFEATVSPDLADLLTASRRVLRQPPPLPDIAPPGGGPEAETCAEPPAAADQGWPRQALRRDGARPLCFAGLGVLSAEARDPAGAAQRRFCLFVTPERRLVAHLAVLPAETLAARPIHRAAYLDDPADLARFLAENDPSACAAVLPCPGEAGAADALWAGLRLALPLSPEHCAGAPPTEG